MAGGLISVLDFFFISHLKPLTFLFPASSLPPFLPLFSYRLLRCVLVILLSSLSPLPLSVLFCMPVKIIRLTSIAERINSLHERPNRRLKKINIDKSDVLCVEKKNSKLKKQKQKVHENNVLVYIAKQNKRNHNLYKQKQGNGRRKGYWRAKVPSPPKKNNKWCRTFFFWLPISAKKESTPGIKSSKKKEKKMHGFERISVLLMHFLPPLLLLSEALYHASVFFVVCWRAKAGKDGWK